MDKVQDPNNSECYTTSSELLRIYFLDLVTRSYKLETKPRGFSPKANYTDRATAACRRS
jgi:hypothetical protein